MWFHTITAARQGGKLHRCSLVDGFGQCFEEVGVSPVQIGSLRGTCTPCRARTDEGAHAQVTAVEPAFNRLVLFDPRLPHGVREVQGTRDPRKGRLVVTGWFTEPTPFFTGALRSPAQFLLKGLAA